MGFALDAPAQARTVALAEAAERYAGMSPGPAAEYMWARVADLDDAVVDMTRIPRCSADEYATPGCPLRPFDWDAPIRWSRGTELVSGAPIWVPSVMAVYGLHDRVPAEFFWHSISTGYAAHTNPYAALCSAICEVVERDINEILWSQRLPLPPVASSELTSGCHRLLRWAEDHFIKVFLFDATTDMGVPTAYALTITEHDPQARQRVACATGITMAAAAEKVVLDGVGVQVGIGIERGPVKTDFREFTQLTDGARYMGLAEHAEGFDFLIDGYHDRVTQERSALPDDPADRLCSLIDTFQAKGMQVVALERTTSELAAAGLTAICVVIPDLQPMTVQPLARFRAHPRLYQAPELMGYRVLPEAELNPWPQPFA